MFLKFVMYTLLPFLLFLHPSSTIYRTIRISWHTFIWKWIYIPGCLEFFWEQRGAYNTTWRDKCLPLEKCWNILPCSCIFRKISLFLPILVWLFVSYPFMFFFIGKCMYNFINIVNGKWGRKSLWGWLRDFVLYSECF